MKEIIESLVKLAGELDSKGLNSIADSIDKVASSVTTIKTAQFVGVQGYWIRNTRCWGNCYRQKRATKKDLSAQQVWEECHKEYVESINNDNSGWEKYANEVDSFVKTASLKQKQYISSESKYFHDAFEEKIASGSSVGDAYASVTEEGLSRYDDKIIEASVELTKIAETVKSSGDNELAEKIALLSSDLLKEAQFGNWFGNLGRSIGQGLKNVFMPGNLQSWLQKMDQGLSNALATYQSNRAQFTNQDWPKIQGEIKQAIPVVTQMIQKANLGEISNDLLSKMNNLVNQGNAQIGQRSNSIMALSKSIAQFLQNAQAAQQKAAPANNTQQPQQPQQPQQQQEALNALQQIQKKVGRPLSDQEKKTINEKMVSEMAISSPEREQQFIQQTSNALKTAPESNAPVVNLEAGDARDQLLRMKNTQPQKFVALMDELGYTPKTAPKARRGRVAPRIAPVEPAEPQEAIASTKNYFLLK